MSITSTVRRISDSFLHFLPRYFYCLYRYIFVDYTKVNVERIERSGKLAFSDLLSLFFYYAIFCSWRIFSSILVLYYDFKVQGTEEGDERWIGKVGIRKSRVRWLIFMLLLRIHKGRSATRKFKKLCTLGTRRGHIGTYYVIFFRCPNSL